MKQALSRGVLLSCTAVLASTCAATEVSVPRIQESGATIENFVPKGYVVEQKEEADLNRDGLSDVVLLIAPDCPMNSSDLATQIEEQCQADGRMMLIVFHQTTGGYRLSISKHIHSTVGNHGDNFGNLEVHGRTISFDVAESSCAGQVNSTWTYQYRFQDDDWYLIGTAEDSEHMSAECDPKGFDINQELCPELSLSKDEVCTVLIRSVNYNTSVEESKWTVSPRADLGGDPDNGARTVIQRKKFPPGRLTLLRDQKLDF